MFMYDPGSPWQDKESLEQSLEEFLLLEVPFVRFTVYADYHSFRDDVQKKQPQLILVSGFHYLQLKRDIKLDPVLIATKGGAPTSNLIVVTQRNRESLREFVGSYIAVRNFGSFTGDLLTSLFFKPYSLSETSFRIIRTAKDFDSLFALYQNQVDLAIVDESQLSYLRRVNIAMTRQMQVIELAKMPNIILCRLPKVKNRPEVASIIEIIAKMNEYAIDLLQQLGYDGWKAFDSNELNTLDQKPSQRTVDRAS